MRSILGSLSLISLKIPFSRRICGQVIGHDDNFDYWKLYLDEMLRRIRQRALPFQSESRSIAYSIMKYESISSVSKKTMILRKETFKLPRDVVVISETYHTPHFRQTLSLSEFQAARETSSLSLSFILETTLSHVVSHRSTEKLIHMV